jgi:hypothetical protein
MPENPYSPPAAESGVLDAPQSHGWKTEGNRVHISFGATLPMIDPYNGKSEDQMALHPLRIKRSPLWIFLPLIGAPVIFLLLALLGKTQNPAIPVMMAACGIAIFATVIIGLFQPSTTLHVFLSSTTVRRMKLTRTLGWATFACYLGSTISRSFVPQYPLLTTFLFWCFATGLVIRILISLAAKQPACRRRIGLLFEIRGLHPDALAYLREEEFRQSNSSRSAGPSHTGETRS